jgi:hypothetical protein
MQLPHFARRDKFICMQIIKYGLVIGPTANHRLPRGQWWHQEKVSRMPPLSGLAGMAVFSQSLGIEDESVVRAAIELNLGHDEGSNTAPVIAFV